MTARYDAVWKIEHAGWIGEVFPAGPRYQTKVTDPGGEVRVDEESSSEYRAADNAVFSILRMAESARNRS